MGLPIFWRLVLTTVIIVGVMTGVTVYALFQMRHLTAITTEMASHHYPAIEAGKRLMASIVTRQQNEKKFLAVRDAAFKHTSEEEQAEFGRTLSALQVEERTPEGRTLLSAVERLHSEQVALFRQESARKGGPPGLVPSDYETASNAIMDRMTEALRGFVDLHEARVTLGMNESYASSARAESATRHLILISLLLGLAVAAIASYSILRPLRRLQAHITLMGQGQFGTPLDISAPRDLRELVDTVNWMGEKLQQLDDMKAEFLAHVSHELRTPMASIQEGTQLLLDEIPGPITPDQQQTLKIMSDSSRRLIRLISTILDLSKMDAGMMDYNFISADFQRMVDVCLNKIRLLADSKQVQLIAELPPQKLYVRADFGRIEQVIDNLLSNALKFSPPGSVIRLQAEPQARLGIVVISVIDQGPGIAKDDAPLIFERFYQGRSPNSRAVAGSGLGLALAKKVVEGHNGRIWIESEVGKGATVRFSLRLAHAGAEA
ncbi:MAG: HAMP domain-containing sensor histidine kinase [Nitrospiraceae bacterium]